MTEEIQIAFELDDKGMVGRQCPATDCERYFKLKPGTGLNSDVTRCPYCGNKSPYLAPFVETTARSFEVSEVSGDKAYVSKNNLRAVQDVGAIPYIPFRANSVAWNRKQKHDSLWERMYHYYNFNRSEFLAHYHKRSNVETTFSMVKAKFGTSVRSKTPVAQVNDVLAKILCHNICVLIQSAYELGISPVFDAETFGTKDAVVPKMAWE